MNTLLFNATRTLRCARKEEYGPIEKEKRGKRDLIKAARGFYLHMRSNATVHKSAPWSTSCMTLEGNVYTGRSFLLYRQRLIPFALFTFPFLIIPLRP
jgi:hypothetical protein